MYCTVQYSNSYVLYSTIYRQLCTVLYNIPTVMYCTVQYTDSYVLCCTIYRQLCTVLYNIPTVMYCAVQYTNSCTVLIAYLVFMHSAVHFPLSSHTSSTTTRMCILPFGRCTNINETVAYPGIFFGGAGWGFVKFSWRQRAERTGMWGR
jgi:hypothetical protein